MATSREVERRMTHMSRREKSGVIVNTIFALAMPARTN